MWTIKGILFGVELDDDHLCEVAFCYSERKRAEVKQRVRQMSSMWEKSCRRKVVPIWLFGRGFGSLKSDRIRLVLAALYVRGQSTAEQGNTTNLFNRCKM